MTASLRLAEFALGCGDKSGEWGAKACSAAHAAAAPRAAGRAAPGRACEGAKVVSTVFRVEEEGDHWL